MPRFPGSGGARKVISGVEEIWLVQFSISWQTEETDRAVSVGPNVEAGGWSINGEGVIGGKRFPANGQMVQWVRPPAAGWLREPATLPFAPDFFVGIEKWTH